MTQTSQEISLGRLFKFSLLIIFIAGLSFSFGVLLYHIGVDQEIFTYGLEYKLTGVIPVFPFFLIIGFIVATLLFLLGTILYIIPIGAVFAGKTNFLYLRIMNGPIGKILNFTPFFKTSSDLYFEPSKVNTNSMSFVYEILSSKILEILILPISISLFLATYLGKTFIIWALEIQNWRPSDIAMNSIGIYLLICVFTSIIMVFILPAIWIINDSGIKQIFYNVQGEINTIIPLGVSIQQGINEIVGISALLNVSNLITSIPGLIENIANDSARGLLISLLITSGLFLILFGSCLPIMGMIYLGYWKRRPSLIQKAQKIYENRKICELKSLKISSHV